MSLPTQIGLPSELVQNVLPDSMPPDAKSYSIKIMPTNVQSVGTNWASGAATTYWSDIQFPQQEIIFDLPIPSPSTFIDTRMTTLSFNATFKIDNAATQGSGTTYPSYLRGGAPSYFSRLQIIGGDGAIIEDFNEFGLVSNTLNLLQLNNSVRDSVAMNYGFLSSDGNQIQGRPIGVFNTAINAALVTGEQEIHSYCIPLNSGLIGTLAEKYLNIGRCNRLQVKLFTDSVLPITGGTNVAWTAQGTLSCTLSNFAINMEYVDIGLASLSMLDRVTDGKMYLHANTWKTSVAQLAAAAGAQSILTGIRASSVKSIIASFTPTVASSTITNLHGKYGSFNPSINSFQMNVGGVKSPQYPINPLLQPALAFYELSKAIGSWNNSLFSSVIIPGQYCRLAPGGTTTTFATTTQDYYWSSVVDSADTTTNLSTFLLGLNMEIIAKHGLMSGVNCSLSPVFAEFNLASQPTYASSVYFMTLIDTVYILEVQSGMISVRT